MKTIASIVGRETKWTQPKAMKGQYELRAGKEVVATLKFRSVWGSFATAESADGCWTFKRVGFWNTRVTIRPCDTETEIAAYGNRAVKNGGWLTMADGRKFSGRTNGLETKFKRFDTEAGKTLIEYKQSGMIHTSAEMTIESRGAKIPELPWMVMLGFYLCVMTRQDAAGAAAGAAAAGG